MLANTNNFYKNNKAPDGLFPYCKECDKVKSTQWIKENPERYKELRGKHHKTEKFKEWNKTNSKKFRENGTTLNWQRSNPDKVKGYRIKYSEKKHNITIKEWESCKKYFIHRCAYCGLPIEEHWIKFRGKIQLGDFHKEHIDDEGANDLSNCVPSCKECNSSKHEFEFEEWYSQQEFYSEERYNRIIKWTTEDYKKYIKKQ